MFRTLRTSPSSAISKSTILGALAAALAMPLIAQGQQPTYTAAGGNNFSNIVAWNFGTGPLPFSDPTGLLTIQSFGASGFTAANDFNLTLQTLRLNMFSSAGSTLSSTLAGNYAFTGAAGIQQIGSGGATTISAPIALGSTATGLTFSGSGLSNTTLSGVISSNTSTGAPITIGTSTAVPNAGITTLSAANTFAGGVVLNSGSLSLNSASALGILGSQVNTLTVNGGAISGQTNTTIINPMVLNSDLTITGGSGTTSVLLLGGFYGSGLTGAGGLIVRPAGSGQTQVLNGINTYSGATTIGQLRYAPTSTPTNAGGLRINGAIGQVTGTSSFNVADGGLLEINKAGGDSLNNIRVNASTAINVTSGFVQVIGSTGLTTTNLGQINIGGSGTILANTSGGANSSTILNFPNLTRVNSGTVVFAGANLGNAAAVAGTNNANIFLAQIGGAAPATSLVGGGGAAGTTTISILPFALGDAANTGSNFAAGTGFVTYGANGVRLLDAVTEYNTTNNFDTAGATDNMRISAAPTGPTAAATVNSVFVSTTGLTIGGTGPLTITSGALAMGNVAAGTISTPVNFGAGGTGEAVVSVVGGLNSANRLLMSGQMTAGTLTKTGHGVLALGSTANVFSTNRIFLNAGGLEISQLSNLGIANVGTSSLNVAMHLFGGGGATNTGIIYTGAGTETFNGAINLNAGHMNWRMTGGGNVTLAGVISGNGGFNVDPGAAGSTITLSGPNTFSGGVRLGGGSVSTFQFTNDGNLGAASGPITINTTGMTVRLLGAWNTTRNIALEGALGSSGTAGAEGFDTAGFNSSWGGPLVGTGNIFKVDSNIATPGTWTITGANNQYTGTINLGTNFNPGGILALTGAGDINSGSVQFGSGAAGVAGTYTLDLSGATGPGTTPWRSFANINTASGFFQAHTIKLGATAGTPVDIRIGQGTFGGAAGVIDGFGKLVKVGGGTLTLDGATANTFTGNVEVWGGSLAISADNQLGNLANTVTLQGGGFNTLTNSITTARSFVFFPTPVGLGGAGPANVFRIAAGTTFQIDGNITGGGGFEKTQTGTLYFTGSNTFGGGATNTGFIKVNQGNLMFNSDANLGALASSGGTGTKIVLLSLGGDTTTPGTLELAAGQGSQTINRYIAFQNANTNRARFLVNAGSTLQYSGTLVGGVATIGTQNLSKIGAGAMVFDANASLYVGTFQVGDGAAATGNVNLTSNANLARTTVTAAANSAATIDMSGLTKEFGAVNLNTGTTLALGTSGVLSTGFVNGAQNIAGDITGGASAAFNKFGTGALTWSSAGSTFAGGFHTYFGATTVNGTGAIPAQSAMSIGSLVDLNSSGSSLTLDNTGTDLGTRIADTQDLFINNSALIFSTNTTTASSETINSLRVGGLSVVTMTTGGTLAFADAANALTRLNRGTLFVRGGSTQLGNAAASTTVPNVTFANITGANLIGGGGGAGTTTISILPYVFSSDTGTAGSTGNSFATYGANGVRPLNTATEYATTFTGSTADTNVRTGTSTTFSGGADGVANSFLITGTANSARFDSQTTEVLRINSGVIGATVTQVYGSVVAGVSAQAMGIQTAQLQTGLGNTRELIVHNMNASLNIGALISTSGGLTKSGPGDLFLTNGANTYTGGTTINGGITGTSTSSQLVIDSLGAVNNFSGGLNLAGGFLRYRGASTTLPGAVAVTLGGGSANNPGTVGGFNIVSGTTLTIGGTNQLSGFGGLSKEGTGVLAISGAQNYSGPTVIHAGSIAIGSAGSLGSNPYVFFSSSNIASTGGPAIRFDAPMVFTKNLDSFTGTGTVGFGFDTNGNNVTFAGQVMSATSTRGVYKFGAGDLTFNTAQTYTGATTVFAGNLVLGGANGSINGTSGTGGFLTGGSINVAPGGGLVLDNSVTANSNRLPDPFTQALSGNGDTAQLISMRGGDFVIRGNSSTPINEFTNRINIFTGTFTLVNNGANVTLTSGRVNRTDNVSLALIRGNNLGATPSATSTNWFSIDEGSGSTQTAGAGGAMGTPFVSIIPGFMADASATGTGTDLVTYDSRVGFRGLTASEYTSTFATTNFDVSRAPIIGVSSATAAPATTSWVSAIKLSAGGAITGAGSINVTTSTVLATGNSSIGSANAGMVLQSIAGNAGYDFLVSGAGTTLTVNAALNGSELFKYGNGNLTLTEAYYGVGAVYVGQGTLTLSGANASLNSVGSNLQVAVGATVSLGGFDRTIGALTSTDTLGNAGLNVTQDGTIDLGANTLTLFDTTAGTFSGDIIGTGGVRKAFNSTGTTSFVQPMAYSGATTIYGGTLRLAGQGTLLNTSRIDVFGGTLQLDNADDNAVAGGYIAQRLSTSTPINLAGGLTITANNNSVSNIAFGTLNLIGNGTITANAGNNAPTTVTFANIARNASAGTLVLTGSNLGLAQAPNGNTRILATQIDGASPTAALVGGSGAGGTTTVSIIPWAWSSNAAGFVTYDSTNGFRPLNNVAGAGFEYETDLDAPSSANANIRTTAAATLTADRTVNSLTQVTTGGVSGAFNLTLNSGALATTATGTIGVNTNNLLTGNGNTRELVVFNSAASTLAYNVTTSGGVTKFGGSALTLTGTNTFTGGLHINDGSVAFAANTALGAAAGGVTFGGVRGSPPAATLTYTGTTFLDWTRPITLDSAGTLSGAANQIWQVNAPITGNGSLGFNVSGSIFELNAANTYRGATEIFFGQVSILGDSAFGDPTSGSEVKFNDVSTQGIILRGDWTTSRRLHVAAAMALNTNGFDTTWNGQVVGGSTITKNGLGTINIGVPMGVTGATFSVNAGGIRFFDRGATGATGNITIGFGAKLTLDDSGQHWSNRIPDATGLITGNNYELELRGNNAVTTEAVINNLTMGLASTVTIVPGQAQAAILRLGQTGVFARSTGGSVLFRGTNLGVNAPGTPNSASMLLFNPLLSAAASIGGGGPADNTAISVIAGSFGDISATGNGTQLVTYDLNRGIRLLNPTTEYALNPALNGTDIRDNVHLTSAVSLPNATTVNALWMDNGAAISGGGTLTLNSSTILVTGTGNSIATPIAAGTPANGIVVGGPGTLEIATAIPNTTTGGLVKRGDGTLILSAANLYTGTTTVSEGTVDARNATAFGATTVRFLGGSLVNGSGGPLTLTNAVGLSGNVTIGGSGDLTFNTGTWTLESATRTINVTNTGVTTINSVIAASSAPAIGLVKTGPGLLVVTGANTYGTLTTNQQFYLSQTTINGGELQVNNTTGSGTGGSTVVVNSGGTLSGTGTIIPQQTLESRNTVVIKSGATLKPGVGPGAPGVLTIGSTTTPGVTTASVDLQSGSRFTFHYTGTQTGGVAVNSGGSATPGATGSSNVRVNGTLNWDPNTVFSFVGNIADFNIAQTYSYRIADADTTNVININSISNPGSFNFSQFVGYSGQFNWTIQNAPGAGPGTPLANAIYVNFTPVPEPVTVIGACAAVSGAFLAIRRLRRRNRKDAEQLNA